MVKIGRLAIILFRLLIWLLLTADGSGINLAIGIVVAVLLPRQSFAPDRLKDWLTVFWKIATAIPIAYIESIEIMLRPHRRESIVWEQVPQRRSTQLIFLDIFLITFTPKTIVCRYDKETGYAVHKIDP